MPLSRASQGLFRFNVLDLTRIRSRAYLRAVARGLGRQCDQDRRPVRAAGGPRHGSDFQNLQRNNRAVALSLGCLRTPNKRIS
jgi:hypothetical protein